MKIFFLLLSFSLASVFLPSSFAQAPDWTSLQSSVDADSADSLLQVQADSKKKNDYNTCEAEMALERRNYAGWTKDHFASFKSFYETFISNRARASEVWNRIQSASIVVETVSIKITDLIAFLEVMNQRIESIKGKTNGQTVTLRMRAVTQSLLPFGKPGQITLAQVAAALKVQIFDSISAELGKEFLHWDIHLVMPDPNEVLLSRIHVSMVFGFEVKWPNPQEDLEVKYSEGAWINKLGNSVYVSSNTHELEKFSKLNGDDWYRELQKVKAKVDDVPISAPDRYRYYFSEVASACGKTSDVLGPDLKSKITWYVPLSKCNSPMKDLIVLGLVDAKEKQKTNEMMIRVLNPFLISSHAELCLGSDLNRVCRELGYQGWVEGVPVEHPNRQPELCSILSADGEVTTAIVKSQVIGIIHCQKWQ